MVEKIRKYPRLKQDGIIIIISYFSMQRNALLGWLVGAEFGSFVPLRCSSRVRVSACTGIDCEKSHYTNPNQHDSNKHTGDQNEKWHYGFVHLDKCSTVIMSQFLHWLTPSDDYAKPISLSAALLFPGLSLSLSLSVARFFFHLSQTHACMQCRQTCDGPWSLVCRLVSQILFIMQQHTWAHMVRRRHKVARQTARVNVKS